MLLYSDGVSTASKAYEDKLPPFTAQTRVLERGLRLGFTRMSVALLYGMLSLAAFSSLNGFGRHNLGQIVKGVLPECDSLKAYQ